MLNILEKNQDNLDRGLALLAPFYRVFANTLGNGRWFDTYIQNLSRRRRARHPAPGWAADGRSASCRSGFPQLIVVVDRWPRWWSARRVFVLLPAPTKTVTARFERRSASTPAPTSGCTASRSARSPRSSRTAAACWSRMKYDRKIKLPAYAADAKVVGRDHPAVAGVRPLRPAGTSPPATTGCAVLADRATIGQNQTASPVELDDIYAALNTLNVALGPEGRQLQLLRTARCRI